MLIIMWAVVYIATFLLMWSKPDSPPFEGGVDAPSRKRSEGTFERRGRRGCFKQPIIDLAATPSAPAKVASQHFLYGRSHPSLERRGIHRFRRKDFGHMDIEITIKTPGPTRNPGLSRNKPGSVCENKSLCHAPGRVETAVLMIFFVSTFFRAITAKNGDIISSQA